jgi:hypothetical protein
LPPEDSTNVPPVGVPLMVTTCVVSPARQYRPDTPLENAVWNPAMEPPCGSALLASLNSGRPIVSVCSRVSIFSRGSAAMPVKS